MASIVAVALFLFAIRTDPGYPLRDSTVVRIAGKISVVAIPFVLLGSIVSAAYAIVRGGIFAALGGILIVVLDLGIGLFLVFLLFVPCC